MSVVVKNLDDHPIASALMSWHVCHGVKTKPGAKCPDALHPIPFQGQKAIAGWKVVGEVKKVGKSRNFQPKVGKSRNFSVFKVGKIRNFYYNFSSFNLSINSKVFPFELFNYHNCLQLSIELYKINFIDVLLNMVSIYCWVINHFPSRTFNKLLSF